MRALSFQRLIDSKFPINHYARMYRSSVLSKFNLLFVDTHTACLRTYRRIHRNPNGFDDDIGAIKLF